MSDSVPPYGVVKREEENQPRLLGYRNATSKAPSYSTNVGSDGRRVVGLWLALLVASGKGARVPFFQRVAIAGSEDVFSNDRDTSNLRSLLRTIY